MKLVILDRDGVVNGELKRPVRKIEDFKILPGVSQAIRRLNQENYKVVLATNQALVGRGEISTSQLEAIHNHMRLELERENAYLDHIFSCTDAEASPRRKPEPGMLLEALKKFNADPKSTPFVGDDFRDLQAAQKAGCVPILVQTGKGPKTIVHPDLSSISGLLVFQDLPAFVEYWLDKPTTPPTPVL